MAENKQFFPGFEGDDEAKPAPAAPAKPVAKQPAFDPFAGVEVKPPSAAEAAAPAAPAKPGAAPTAKPGPAAPAPARLAPPPAADEADIKPGSRKDLWKCPHCGAGNKPDRSTCRTCGKSPSEAVIVPWHKKPAILGGIAAGVVLLIVLIAMASCTDLSLHEPDLARVDAKPRIGGSASGSYELGGGVRLEVERRIGVCGRVAAVGGGPGQTVVVALALGAAAADEHPTAEPVPGGGFRIDQGVVLACSADPPLIVKPGQILSLTGETGWLIRDSAKIREAAEMIAVRVGEAKAR